MMTKTSLLSERYAELLGGLNRMIAARFQVLLRAWPNLRVDQFCVMALHGVGALTAMPVVREFFAPGVRE